MNKIGPKNPLIKRIILIVIIFLASIGIIIYAISILKNSNDVYFNLGTITDYNEQIISSYKEYKDFSNKYKINYLLSENDFINNNYLMSFQAFDRCSETKPMTLKNVNYNDNNVSVKFNIHNKCGWCKPQILLYIIKIGKVNKDAKINYEYTYDKKLNCGTI